jgi:para-aminobenzoate synthetase component I
MQPTMFEDWQRWHHRGARRLPLIQVHCGEALPPSFERFADTPVSVLLESVPPGRYTYLCDRAERIFVGHLDGVDIRSADGSARLGWRAGKPLDALAVLLAEVQPARPEAAPPMIGGIIGAFGYDLVHTWERLPRCARRDLPLPLFIAAETRELFVFDHHERTLFVVVWSNTPDGAADALREPYAAADNAARAAHRRWQAGGGGTWSFALPAPELRAEAHDSFTPEDFQEAVRQVKAYIADGHTYQTNLSLRSTRPAPAHPEVIYEAVRRVNPSPYMGLLRTPDFALVCGSPELLVRMIHGTIISRPIAGTRPRGHDAARDHDLSAELFVNEKERAEHLMLVDLIRNDIGRVAAWGSVRVREFMTVERYSHVMHLVSEVEGRLAAGRTWADVLRAMFPGGTITGCPKIRTMEIIEELEPVARGFYTGSLGWISYSGDMEMNIIIRSLLVQGGLAHVQAGAGIVADSHPEREFEEVTHKARALWVALDAASRHG